MIGRENNKTLDLQALASKVAKIAHAAGQEILRHYYYKVALSQETQFKPDGSPLTQADLAAHWIIVEGLTPLIPECPIISEESPTLPDMPPGQTFWLVDPLDGTSQYLKRTGEFTVNIALIEKYRPVLGVIYLPTQDLLFTGYGKQAFTGQGDTADIIITGRDFPLAGLAAVLSRNSKKGKAHNFLLPGHIFSKNYVASSLKFCLIAQGRFDIHVHTTPTCEWDTAAGQAIVEAVGGAVITTEGKALDYQKSQWANPSFMVLGRKP